MSQFKTGTHGLLALFAICSALGVTVTRADTECGTESEEYDVPSGPFSGTGTTQAEAYQAAWDDFYDELDYEAEGLEILCAECVEGWDDLRCSGTYIPTQGLFSPSFVSNPTGAITCILTATSARFKISCADDCPL